MEGRMDTVEIETGVALPRKLPVLPYTQLQVGESFLVVDRVMRTVLNLNYKMGKKLGRKFTCRKEEKGIRVWRIV
jgi:hypothetical protein